MTMAVAQLPDPTMVTSVVFFSGIILSFAAKVEIAAAIVKKKAVSKVLLPPRP